MSNNTFPNLYETIESSQHPIVLLIVGGACDKMKGPYEEEFERLLQERPENLIYYVSCIPEQYMGFPRFAVPTTYYFVPKNPTPVFWRGQDAIARLDEDIPVLCKMAQGMSEVDARFSEEDKARIIKTDAMLASEDMDKFPPLFQQFRNLAKETWNTGKRAAMGLPVLLTAEQAFTRFQECQGCDQFESGSNRCRSCGCNMKLKTQLVGASCPLSKWPKP